MAGRTIPNALQKEALLTAITRGPARTHAVVALCLNSGLRCVEVSRLTLAHVLDAGRIRRTLRVTRRDQKGGRGKYKRAVRTREIPLNDEARVALERFLPERLCQTPNAPTSPLFLSRERGALSRWQLNRLVQDAFSDAGLSGLGAWGVHSLRKAFARAVYETSGFNLLATKIALSHSRAATTECYLAVDDDEVADVIRRIGTRSGSDTAVYLAANNAAFRHLTRQAVFG